MYCILANVVLTSLQRGVQYFCNRFHHNTFFSPQQVRKRHCFSKEVQLVDALEVYNQRKNGELTVHSEKSVKNTSPKTVSNVITAPMPGLLVHGQLSKVILTWAFVWLRVAFILITVCFHFKSCFPVCSALAKEAKSFGITLREWEMSGSNSLGLLMWFSWALESSIDFWVGYEVLCAPELQLALWNTKASRVCCWFSNKKASLIWLSDLLWVL